MITVQFINGSEVSTGENTVIKVEDNGVIIIEKGEIATLHPWHRIYAVTEEIK